MRKVKSLSVFLIAILCLATFAFAQDGEKMQTDIKNKRMQTGKMKSNSMKNMAMKKMMEKQIVATEDGGVVVLVGNKLLKYDKKLNLINETEIEIDYDAMHKMMKKKMRECQGCKKKKEMIDQKKIETPKSE